MARRERELGLVVGQNSSLKRRSQEGYYATNKGSGDTLWYARLEISQREHLRDKDYDNGADDGESRGRVYLYAHATRNTPGRLKTGRAQVAAGENEATKVNNGHLKTYFRAVFLVKPVFRVPS